MAAKGTLSVDKDAVAEEWYKEKPIKLCLSRHKAPNGILRQGSTNLAGWIENREYFPQPPPPKDPPLPLVALRLKEQILGCRRFRPRGRRRRREVLLGEASRGSDAVYLCRRRRCVARLASRPLPPPSLRRRLLIICLRVSGLTDLDPQFIE